MDPQIYAHAGIHMHRINTVGTDALIVMYRTLKPTEVQERTKPSTHTHTHKYTLLRLLGSQQLVLQGADLTAKDRKMKTIQR